MTRLEIFAFTDMKSQNINNEYTEWCHVSVCCDIIRVVDGFYTGWCLHYLYSITKKGSFVLAESVND